MQGAMRGLGARPPTSCGGASCSGRVGLCSAQLNSRGILSTSGRGSHRQRILPPCRITSTQKELFQSKEAKDMNIVDKGDDEYMDLPDPQVFDAEKGPLEKRIQRTFDQAVKDDIVDLRDTEYWFSTPEENWNSKPQRVHFMQEDEEPLTPQPWHPPQEGLTPGQERIAFTELEEGRVYVGMVTDVWLYHGVQVDIGAEFDGLIPCTEDQWELAVDHIDVGEVVLVEVHKMWTPGLYRWPLQLKFCVKGLQDMMTPPDEYTSPVDHGWAEEQGWSPEDIADATGRTLEVPTYFLPHDEQKLAEDVIDGYGTGNMYWRAERSEPLEDYVDDPLEDPTAEALARRQAEADAAAADLLLGGGGL